MIAAAAIFLGLLLGVLSGGSPNALSQVRIRFEWIVLIGFVLQALIRGRLPHMAQGEWGLVVWAGVSLVLIGVLALQPSSAPLVLVAVGLLLNLLVVLLNGSMPVLANSSALTLRKMAETGGFYQILSQGQLLVSAADILPLRIGSGTFMLSIGDMLIALGAALVIVIAMCETVGQKEVH